MIRHIVFLVMTFGCFHLFVCWLCRIRLWRAVVAGFIAAAPGSREGRGVTSRGQRGRGQRGHYNN